MATEGLLQPLLKGNTSAYRTTKGRVFFAQLTRGTEACIFWPMSRTKLGYAQHIHPEFSSILVHRNVCIRFNGYPVQPRQEACHSCGNGHLGCVNPDHLSWKTHAENMDDARVHGTRAWGEKNGQAKLTEEQIAEIRLMRKQGYGFRIIGEAYGIVTSHAYNICSGNRWKHV